jgi:hypothetical protein
MIIISNSFEWITVTKNPNILRKNKIKSLLINQNEWTNKMIRVDKRHLSGMIQKMILIFWRNLSFAAFVSNLLFLPLRLFVGIASVRFA